MRKMDHPEDQRLESKLQTRSLEEEVRVLWAQQLFIKTRVKRRPPTSVSDSDVVVSPEERELIRVKRSAADAEEEEIFRQIKEILASGKSNTHIPS